MSVHTQFQTKTLPVPVIALDICQTNVTSILWWKWSTELVKSVQTTYRLNSNKVFENTQLPPRLAHKIIQPAQQ